MTFVYVMCKHFEKRCENRLSSIASKHYQVTPIVGELQPFVQLPLPALLHWLPTVHKFASVSTQFHLCTFCILVTHFLAKVCPASLLFVFAHTVENLPNSYCFNLIAFILPCALCPGAGCLCRRQMFLPRTVMRQLLQD